MTYTFIYLGEVQPTSEINNVQKILANKFHIPTSEVLPLFDNNHKFERKGLSKEVAEAYKTEFSEAGALSHVIEDVSIQAKPNKTAPTSKKPNKSNKKTSSATIWLKWAGIFIVGLMIGDDYLQSAQVITRSGFDIGRWPLALAHIPLLIGCSLLAREKKWPTWFGALGLLSLAGLSLLLLMPSKGQRDYKLGIGSLGVTLFTFAVFFYWLNGFSSSSALENELLLTADNLHLGRSEYPASIQSSLSDYQEEQDELYDFMNKLISAVEAGEFRPDTVSALGDRMFSELARYLIWRKYQFFKHKSQGIKLPEGLSSGFTKENTRLFKSLINKPNQFHMPRLFEARNAWLIAVDDNEYGSTQSKVGRKLDFIFDAVRNGNINYSRSKKPAKNVNVKTLGLRELPGAKLERHENHIEYIFVSGPLTGKSIAIGFYHEVVKPKFGNTLSYRHKYAVISHGYPAKYLSNLLGVFEDYK